ncbi:hypothetical protein H2O64_21285 [Kordia sp. YSTF-M3]|uniref:Lipoprotein n=1 Tax=Kordia aestuariivivens TaxID=2759037 RepID=A0ABR7QF65_9FLAO|nr:hypothetical protein [Kordia aestuariivivens]MBC8757217.1 hypothetical protein [Kordia aestuariivivens]
MKKNTFLILLLLLTFSCNSDDKKNIEKIHNLISQNKIDSALIVIKAEKKIKHDAVLSKFVKDKRKDINELIRLKHKAAKSYENIENSIIKSRSIEFVKEIMTSLSDSDFKKLKKGDLKTIFLKPQKLNDNFIGLMSSEAHNRDSFVKEIAEEASKKEAFLESRRKFLEDSRKEEIQKNTRKDNVEKQFNKRDGSHIKLTKFIKENMHDPSSYEHIETKYKDNKNYIFVTTKYRGKNAFGAKVITTTSINTDIDGNIIKVLK